MKIQLLSSCLVVMLIGCSAPQTTVIELSATPTVMETATQIRFSTRIPTRTWTQTPTITPTPTVYEILEPLAQSMYGESAKPIVDFFLAIQDCVRNDDRVGLAGMVLYPISVYTNGQQKIELRNEKDFIAQYSQIATTKWKQTVLEQDPAELFMNWQGVMIGSGEIWFSPVCMGEGGCEETKLFIISIHPAVP